MKVAVIGAGFLGLAAASDLANKGHQVTVFEAAPLPGGLAAGFQNPGWDWTIEKHYHHIFSSDTAIKNWLTELSLASGLVFKKVKTATLFQGKIRSLDSIVSLLSYQPLKFLNRLKLGFGLGLLKIWPWGDQLDRWPAADWIKKVMGQESWQKVWKPLFVGKFGKFSDRINLAWFWARIVARTADLGIYRGGFGRLAIEVSNLLQKHGVIFKFGQPVKSLRRILTDWRVETQSGFENFDQVLIAAESRIALQLTKGLAATPAQKLWQKKNTKLAGLGAITLVLELDAEFFNDGTYWLNINEPGWPFLAVVEQTRLTGIEPFDHHSIVYVGKYGDVAGAEGQQWLSQTDVEIFEKYLPFLKLLKADFESHLISKMVFREAFAQPLVFVNHRKNLPTIDTPWQDLYWASMQQVYPWDRGINHAVRLGRKAAKIMMTARS